MRKYCKGSQTTYDLNVHLIWITKYSYKALARKISERIINLLRQIGDANQIEIIEGHVGKDYIPILGTSK